MSSRPSTGSGRTESVRAEPVEARKRLTLPRLLVVTDRHSTGGRPLGAAVRSALEAGARLVQLREKDLEGGALTLLAAELRALTREFDAELLINDRIDVALAADADGVVLPASSFATADARRLLGRRKILARSTHSAAEVERAAREGVDFVLFGPVHATPAKSAYGEPQGIERLREVTRLGIPVYAIGGITAENAADVLGVGARGVAVIRAAMDPSGGIRPLVTALGA